ncbi:hypothetical protein H4R27_004572 [Coemansia aciculifera]|nr:hypothetical protein H4R27_004572 [Coemansia aciculifera]
MSSPTREEIDEAYEFLTALLNLPFHPVISALAVAGLADLDNLNSAVPRVPDRSRINKIWNGDDIPRGEPRVFSNYVRMPQHKFVELSELLRSHPNFVHRQTRPRDTVGRQLSMMLYQLGQKRPCVHDIARQWGILESSVELYTWQVIDALDDVLHNEIRWSNLRHATFYPVGSVFEKYLGYAGGSQVVLGEQRSTHLNSYRIEIATFLLDNTCSQIKLSQPDLDGRIVAAMKKFDSAHKKERVVTEQVFGVWKSMFRSLKRLPLSISTRKRHERVIKWIRVTAMLYNFVHPTDEELEDIVYYAEPDSESEPDDINGSDTDTDAVSKSDLDSDSNSDAETTTGSTPAT